MSAEKRNDVDITRDRFHDATMQAMDESEALRLIRDHPDAFLKQDLGKEHPLEYAVLGGMPEVVNAMLDLGVDVNHHMGPRTGRAIEVAIHFDQMECAKLLLEKGANPNVGWVMIHALHKKPEDLALQYVSLLLRYGCDPRRRFNCGRDDAFSYADKRGCKSVVICLERFERFGEV